MFIKNLKLVSLIVFPDVFDDLLLSAIKVGKNAVEPHPGFSIRTFTHRAAKNSRTRTMAAELRAILREYTADPMLADVFLCFFCCAIIIGFFYLIPAYHF
jgi:hypothetical protein